MAAYREHVTVSGLLGVGYGAAAALSMGFTPVQGCLAACFTWVAGMLPDLDADRGRPVREVFGLVAAIVPLTVEHCLLRWDGTTEGAIFVGILLYVGIRYGLTRLIKRFTVHRGMFHSIPAALIAAQLVFLGFPSDDVRVRMMLAIGVLVGVLSHLVLDEAYSMEWTGVRVKFNKAAGTALKFAGRNTVANVLAYAALFGVTWFTLNEAGWVERPPGPEWLYQQATGESNPRL